MDKTFGIRDPRLTYRDRPGAYLIDITDGRLACVHMHLGYLLPGGGIEAAKAGKTASAVSAWKRQGARSRSARRCARPTPTACTTAWGLSIPFSIITAAPSAARSRSRPSPTILSSGCR